MSRRVIDECRCCGQKVMKEPGNFGKLLFKNMAIIRVYYDKQRVYTLRLLTHPDYDKNK